MRYFITLLATCCLALVFPRFTHGASVKPGDLITPDNASSVTDLVSPGNLYLVKQGMRMKCTSSEPFGQVGL